MYPLLETRDLYLGRAERSDLKSIYKNVWSSNEAARYIYQNACKGEREARARLIKVMDFQRSNYGFFIYKKDTREAIGYATVAPVSENVWEEQGIVIGPAFTRHGYGRQVLSELVRYCRDIHGAREFIYTVHSENEASAALARSCGFVLSHRETRSAEKFGGEFFVDVYKKKL